MKRTLQRVFFSAILSLAVSAVYSQDLTGIWRGHFIDTGGYMPQQYRFEVQINQGSSGVLNGVTYSYSQREFYGKADFTGNFMNRSGNALVQEMRTVEVKGADSSSVCIMKCYLTLVRSGKEEFLEGVFSSAYEYNGYGHQKGDPAGGGRVYLRKVKTSDFYVEPSLRARIEKNENPNPPAVVQNKPPASDPNRNKQTTQKKTDPPKTTPNRSSTAKNNTSDNSTLKKDNTPAEKDNSGKLSVDPQKSIVEKPAIPVPSDLSKRTNELVKTIFVDVPEVTVKLYDNGEIDDDTISVYLDNKLIVSRQKLTTLPITVKVKLDRVNDAHELVMVANNLGRIPPNTSLMIVEAGSVRQEVRITSTEQKNAVVRFKYTGKDDPLPLP